MGFPTNRLNELLTSIIGDLKHVKPSLDNFATIEGKLGTSTSNVTQIASPLNIETIWGTVSNGAVQTTNNPDDGTSFNYAVWIQQGVNTLALHDLVFIGGVMQIVTPVIADTYGAGLFLEYIKISLVEV